MPRGDLLADRLVRQPDAGHQRERLEPAQRVLGRVGVHGRERAVVAGVERGQQVERLGARAPRRPRSGRAASAARCAAGRGSSPRRGPRRSAGRLSSRTTCGWRRRSSAASSIVTTRSPAAMKLESALSSVVLPEPVPPLTRMLRRARDRVGEQVAQLGGQRARARPARRGRAARRAKRRIESAGPSTASGGITTLTREPSASRASTIGLSSSTRRPSGARIRSIASRSASSRREARRRSRSIRPRALDVDRARRR